MLIWAAHIMEGKDKEIQASQCYKELNLYCILFRCSTDGNKPDVSLEDANLIQRMFSLFHGSEQKSAQLPPDKKALPASPAVRARLMSLLKRSLVAANSFPDNLQVCTAA